MEILKSINIRCTNCGKEIANDSQFCEYCGAKVSCGEDKATDIPKVKWIQLILGIIGFVVGGYFMLRSGGWLGRLMLLAIVGIIAFAAYKNKK